MRLDFRFRRRSDGSPLTRIQIEQMVSSIELALALAIAAAEDDVAPSAVSRARVLACMREQFAWFGQPSNWSEPDVDLAPDFDECIAAVRALWPEAFGS